jgi:hypothetical protein
MQEKAKVSKFYLDILNQVWDAPVKPDSGFA